MKIVAILTFIACSACRPNNIANASQQAVSAEISGKSNVYYLAFQAERYAGYSETEIGKVGCSYTIDRAKFSNILDTASASTAYNSLNVTAEVDFSPTETYFIDRNGKVVDHGDVKMIDKNLFEKSLTLVPTKRCHF